MKYLNFLERKAMEDFQLICKIEKLYDKEVLQKEQKKEGDLMDIILNPNYWDCECESDYIHPNTDKKCNRCGALREEQPESRKDEVIDYVNKKSVLIIQHRQK